MMKKKPKTTLKLWEKSFLLTFCVFFILLNIAFGIWSVYQFKSALTRGKWNFAEQRRSSSPQEFLQ